MNNGEYWQKRFELLEQAAHQQGFSAMRILKNNTDRRKSNLKVRLLHGISVLHLTMG